jgi:hypothetical protein
MKNYVPKEGSLPARLIAHLTEYGGSVRSTDMTLLFDVAPKNISPSLVAALANGAVVKHVHDGRVAYALPGADVPAPTITKTRVAQPRSGAAGRAKANSNRKTQAPYDRVTAAQPVVPAAALGTAGDASARQVGGTHYKDIGIQPWAVVDTWPMEQRIGYYRGGALKYLMRMGSKDVGDLEAAKGLHYFEKLLEVLKPQGAA